MRKYYSLCLITSILLIATSIYAENLTTKRIPQFSNNQVNVWQTIIYPSKNQVLKMHRHEFNRVLVAFDSGTLKITNNKNQSHLLKLAKGQAYYLEKDVPNESHTDENISQNPIKVTVIELKDKD